MIGAIFSFIGSIFQPATKLIDDLHTSDEEKLQLKNELAKMQFEVQGKVLEYETRLMESQASIIKAEAQSPNKLTSAWRPIVMLTFTGLIVARWMGWTAPGLTEELELSLFELIKIGLGGYVVGRSGEKMMKAYSEIKKQ